MNDPEIERFGRSLVQVVRDHAIAECDRLISGAMTGPDGERWRAVATSSGQRQALTTLVPDIVDQVLFEPLDAIDNERLPFAWQTSEGRCVPLSELGQGELAGWLMGSPG